MAKKTKTDNEVMAPFDPSNRPAHVGHSNNIPVPQPESLLAFPVVKLMQALSPELDDSDLKFIEGAMQGDILITDGVKSILSDGFKFAPLLVRKVWNEWVPRKQGGGFVASYNTKEEMEMNFTAGNEVVVSIDYLIATNELPDSDGISLVMLQFNTPTKMALAREMAGHVAKYGTMEGVTYNLTSAKRKNRAGQPYYNYMITPVGWTGEKLLAQLRELVQESSNKFLPAPDEAAF